MIDIIPNAWHNLWEWVRRNDVTLDLIVLWALCIGTLTMSVAKFIAWWTIRGTRDRTDLGQALKRQKFTEGFFWVGLSGLYAMTLATYYFSHQFGPPERTALRVFLMAAIVSSLFYVARFIYYLRKERRVL